jgi:hypothetical protein
LLSETVSNKQSNKSFQSQFANYSAIGNKTIYLLSQTLAVIMHLFSNPASGSRHKKQKILEFYRNQNVKIYHVRNKKIIFFKKFTNPADETRFFVTINRRTQQ